MWLRHPSIPMCLGLVSFGFVLGVASDWTRVVPRAIANSLDANLAERLYGELREEHSPLLAASMHQAKIAQLCTPSVVHIEAERFAGSRKGMVEETGSGIIVSNKRFPGDYIVTNRHVVEGTELNRISIYLHDGRIISPVRLWTDKASDLAIMRVSAEKLHPARWGDSRKLEIGHVVYAMGSPFGLSQSMTQGIISAKGRRALELGPNTEVINQDFLQTDAAINPGNSGGPLINLQGEIVGINTAIASNSGGNEGIGFSIPSALVIQVIEQLLEHGKVNRAYLGVKLDPEFDLRTAQRLKLDRLRGARVLQVFENTPAYRANLVFDDVVLYFDGVEVQDENHLIHLVSLQPVNKEVTAIVLRGGNRITIKLRLSERLDTRQSSRSTNQPGNGTRIEELGLTLNELNAQEARDLGFPQASSGLLVLSVDRQSPLAGRVQLYDLIEEIARTPVGTVQDVKDLLKTRDSIDNITVKIHRSEKGAIKTHVVMVEGNSNHEMQ